MPPSMRESLYFKDDDARLSFLRGNYITLTNLTEADIQRIIGMRISPINISIHTTNPELRVMMLRNPRAGKALEHMKAFADAGLILNGQIVVCPGYNDGDELRRTLSDLKKLYPSMHSVSVVPVGLTKYREGLCELKPVGKEEALEIIETVDKLGNECVRRRGTRIFYCADELYLTAGSPLPPVEYYEDFPQIENGVGMAALFEREFRDGLEELPADATVEPFAIATGELFYPILCKLIDLLKQRCNNIHGRVYAVENRFFGERITVAGLVTGRDLTDRLKEELKDGPEGGGLPGRLFIPSTMLRAGETVFLDDLTCRDVERELGVRVIAVENDGRALLKKILTR
jgi:putative radical SAM enzyme (TIGR03279 family)